jgi:hypothetical protein
VKDAADTPTLDQERPKRVSTTHSPANPFEQPRYLDRSYELPHVEVTRFAEHLSDELIAPWGIGLGQRLAQLGDRHILVP